MIKRIKIQPLSPSSSILLSGAYPHPTSKNMVFLDSNRDLHTKVLPPDRKQFMYTIRPRQSYEFTINTENASDRALLQFWELHPQVKVAGKTNPNLTAPLFMLTDLYDAEVMKNTSIVSRFEIAKRIFEMNDSELNSLIFALNGDPRNMTDMAVKQNYLIGDDFISGRAMVLSDRFNMYINSSEKDRRIHTYVFKAIKLGVIPTVDNMYMFAGKTLGDNPERVINYFLSDSELFESAIVPEVDIKSKTDEPEQPAKKAARGAKTN